MAPTSRRSTCRLPAVSKSQSVVKKGRASGPSFLCVPHTGSIHFPCKQRPMTRVNSDATSKTIRFWLAVCALIAVAVWCYLPGLTGGFLFDDFANLSALGQTGPIHDAPSFWRYITSGTADPTGRPIALLSFLVDAQNWPADPAPFKRTNLALHALNTGLLAATLRRLMASAPAHLAASRNLIAVGAAAVWCLHPLMVSTTLYVVQREAMLPATFVLLALLSWLHGRERWIQSSGRSGLGWLILGTGICTLLATLSKANGMLLPTLIGVLEISVLSAWSPAPAALQPRYRRLCLLLLGLPTLLILLYLIRTGIVLSGTDLSANRPWTIGERLLTQPRVLLDYLSQLIVPRPFGNGLFNDAYSVSRSLFSPPSTVPSAFLIVAAVTIATVYRQRHPIAASAVLFFFAGHLLESTTVPLELYFEHRNYLPAMLLGWPLMIGVHTLGKHRFGRASLLASTTIVVALIVGIGAMTHARASLWGNTTEQALVWGQLNPGSSRAQAYAAQAELSMGRPDLARQRLERALTIDPISLQLQLVSMDAYCATGEVPTETLDAAWTAFNETRNPGGLLVTWFGRAIDAAGRKSCGGLDFPQLTRLLSAAESNPSLQKIPGRMQDILHLRGTVALESGNAIEAASLFQAALLRNPKASLALKQAALLGSKGAAGLGLAHLAAWEVLKPPKRHPGTGMPAIHEWVLDQQQYWNVEIAHMRRTLLEDLEAAQTRRTETPNS